MTAPAAPAPVKARKARKAPAPAPTLADVLPTPAPTLSPTLSEVSNKPARKPRTLALSAPGAVEMIPLHDLVVLHHTNPRHAGRFSASQEDEAIKATMEAGEPGRILTLARDIQANGLERPLAGYRRETDNRVVLTVGFTRALAFARMTTPPEVVPVQVIPERDARREGVRSNSRYLNASLEGPALWLTIAPALDPAATDPANALALGVGVSAVRKARELASAPGIILDLARQGWSWDALSQFQGSATGTWTDEERIRKVVDECGDKVPSRSALIAAIGMVDADSHTPKTPQANHVDSRKTRQEWEAEMAKVAKDTPILRMPGTLKADDARTLVDHPLALRLVDALRADKAKDRKVTLQWIRYVLSGAVKTPDAAPSIPGTVALSIVSTLHGRLSEAGVSPVPGHSLYGWPAMVDPAHFAREKTRKVKGDDGATVTETCVVVPDDNRLACNSQAIALLIMFAMRDADTNWTERTERDRKARGTVLDGISIRRMDADFLDLAREIDAALGSDDMQADTEAEASEDAKEEARMVSEYAGADK